jgi:hypothetical protein
MQGTDFGYIAVSVTASLFSAGVAYGVMKTKVDDLREEVERMQRRCIDTHAKIESREQGWVTKDVFNAVVTPMAHALEELQKDVKKILALVSHRTN